MFSNLPMYQNLGAVAYRPDLSRMNKLSSYLNEPQNKFKSIHIAGTNGKGSTAHMLSSIIQEAGYKVGLYTSPHLKEFRERITVNNIQIEKSYVTKFISENKFFFTSNKFSFFEMTVGLAFYYFAQKKVDIAIIEVGMGGRLDATNILNPEVSIITNIGLDHTKFLGDNLSDIAFEKAGIIKQDTPVVIGETTKETKRVFQKKASEMSAPIIFSESKKIDHYNSDLKGIVQQKNIRTVVSALKFLKNYKITKRNITDGLLNIIKNTSFRGRWQVVEKNPLIIFDLAHNVEAMTYVANQLSEFSSKELHLVLGFVGDKPVSEIINLFPLDSKFYFSSPMLERALPLNDLERLGQNLNLNFNIYSSVLKAFESAKNKAKKNDIIFVGGSTFVLSEIL